MTLAPSPSTALIVGLGGLGCPAALALGRAGVRLLLADDDAVDLSNLHRQILYRDADVGRDKLEAARDGLIERGVPEARIELVRTRLLPDNARELVRRADVVLEGSDNYATKFLAADACHLEQRALVQGAAIRWSATVLSVSPRGAPCYRCLFEDVPPARAGATCAEAGVIGPVVGFAGALMADQALRILSGAPDWGAIQTFDGRSGALRRVPVNARRSCPLCGPQQDIFDLRESRYTAPAPCA